MSVLGAGLAALQSRVAAAPDAARSQPRSASVGRKGVSDRGNIYFAAGCARNDRRQASARSGDTAYGLLPRIRAKKASAVEIASL
jgi:hypothetical protein